MELIRYTLSNPHRLPSPYLPLAFITSSTGSEYIDTGIKISDASNIAYKVRFTKRVLYSSYLTTSWYITGGGDFQTGIGSLYYYSNNTIYSLYINSYTHSKNTPRSFPENSIIDYYATIDFANATTTQWYNGENLGSGSFTKFTPGTGTIRICNNWKGGNHYGFRLWKDGSLVRDMVPCLNSSTSLCGLFDLVTQTFYGNSGSGSGLFIGGPELRALPPEYLQVEYLESTGLQVLNTGYTVNSSISVDMDFSTGTKTTNSDSEVYLYGCSTWAYDSYALFNRCAASENYIKYHGTEVSMIGYSPNTRYKFTTNASLSSNNATITNIVSGTTATKTLDLAPTNPTTMLLFGIINSATYRAKMKLYSFTMKDGSTIVRDLIPCYRRSDMKPGMYDLVGGGFYTNSGSGEFLLGPTASSGGLVEWNGTGAGSSVYDAGVTSWTTVNSKANYQVLAQSTNNFGLPDGASYTLSFDVSTASATKVAKARVEFWNSSSNRTGPTSSVYVSNGSGRVYVSGTILSGYSLMRLCVDFNGGSDVVTSNIETKWKNLKLERGSVATPYCPNSHGLPHSLHSSPLHPSGTCHNLPVGYLEVEYVESTGGGYINTDWKPTSGGKVEMDIQCTTNHNASYTMIAGYATSSSWKPLGYGLSGQTPYLWLENGSTATISGTLYLRMTVTINSGGAVDGNFSIGTIGGTPGGYQKLAMKIYGCKIYNGSTLVREIFPCINTTGSSPVVGMYDRVNGVFYQALGTLSPGPAIGRNEGSTEFGRGDSSYKLVTNNFPGSSLSNCSISFWRKGPGAYQWLPFIGLTSSYYLAAQYAGCGSTYHANAGSPRLYCDGVKTTLFPIDSEWHHYVIAGANLSSWTKFQVNAYGGGWSGGGCYYDIRIFDNAIDRNSSGNEDLSLIQAIYLAK